MSTAAPLPRHPTLTFTGSLIAILGLGFAILAVAMPDLLAKLYAFVAAPGITADAGPSSRLGAGIYGGLMVGWGLTLALLGRGQSIPRAAVLGAVAWFVVDSTCSIVIGFAWNAASNALFLAPFLTMLPSLGRGRDARAATR